MLLFCVGLLILTVGYYTYGRFVEKVLGPDDRVTPAIKYGDGVDYIVLPHWKNMLIQLLNIAGIGPVIGVIAGIKFGAIVFLIIPIGNIIGGATHDFISGMASLRNGGSNLPNFVKMTLGRTVYGFFAIFMCALLLLIVAVFINVPANLIDSVFFPDGQIFWYAVAVIFLYYAAATLFPVDKIIGMFYPIFGGLLLLGSAFLMISLFINGVKDPSILQESAEFAKLKTGFLVDNPLIPCLFVTIACGILSGFHATQSPIIARTMKTERQARSSFYGMMVLEGIIAMVWAAGALAVYNHSPELWKKAPARVLPYITSGFLGKGLGAVTVIAVIILAITSGDTAMRSLRLSLAEMLKVNQKPFLNRIMFCIPLCVLVALLLVWSNTDAKSFGQLWNYFAWGNQTLAVFTLGGGCVWLYAMKKQGWIAAIPGAFMMFIVLTFILWTSAEHNGPVGLGAFLSSLYLWGTGQTDGFKLVGSGLDLHTSYIVSAFLSVLYIGWCIRRGVVFSKKPEIQMEEPATFASDSTSAPETPKEASDSSAKIQS